MAAQTSDRISSLAARYVKADEKDLTMMTTKEASIIARDIRTMAASLLRQDETKGLRQKLKLVFGR